jgi:penicillin-binding protein 1A
MYVSKHLIIGMGQNARPYEVDNYDFIHRGPITLEKALADSDNTVFVQLALDLGLQKVVEMVNELGIDSEVDAYPSTAIGGLRVGVTPLEMASAYSTFANSGTHMEPYLVQKLTKEDKGKDTLLEEHRTIGEDVLSRDEAAVVTEALRAVIERGTASYYHDLDAEIGRPAAGKTGTSNRFIDAWFIGFIPQLSTSVWVGYPNERRSMVNINGLYEINGENYPLDIWSLYMQSAVQKYPIQQFDTPSPDLHLEVKTDGLTYVKPAPPPEPEKAKEEKSGDTKEEDPGPENTVTKPEGPGSSEGQPPSAPDSDQEPPSQQFPASASPSSASPEPDGG